MKIIIFLFSVLVFFTQTAFADENTLTAVEQKNISIVKDMFHDFAEKLSINKLDTYYTKDFVLESNGKKYSYQDYKTLEQNIYKTLKSLQVTKYDDIFAKDNKVVSRMSIRLIKQNGDTNEFQVLLIALIKDNKIDKIWEITYPSWSEKLPAKI